MVTIRKCHESDQKAAKELIANILKEEFPKESTAFPIEDLNNINHSYGKLGEAFFVASENGSIIGTVAIKQEDERTALLRRLFVDTTFRRKKIGSQLIDRAIDFCREVGYDELIFKTTSTMSHAIRLCEAKGFVPRARLDLGPVQLVKFTLFLKNESVLPQKKTVPS